MAALLRPLNLVAPGVGLLLSVSPWGEWWMFPVSIVPYLIMVMLSLRDPKFISRAVQADDATAGEPVAWDSAFRAVENGEIVAPLKRIQMNEQRLVDQLVDVPTTARSIVMGALGQVRQAARLAIDLAKKVESLDATLKGLQGNAPEQARWEATERRRRAEQTDDPATKQAFLDAAQSLEESAKSTDAMVKLRERMVAQIENLAASLESVAVRSIRLRVSADDADLGGVGEALRVDVQAAKETLGVFEEQAAMEESATFEVGTNAKSAAQSSTENRR